MAALEPPRPTTQLMFDLHVKNDEAGVTARVIEFLRSDPTADHVAQELVLAYLQHVGARAAIISEIHSDATVRISGAFGLSDQVKAQFFAMSMWDAVPPAAAIRAQNRVVVPTASQFARDFPHWPEHLGATSLAAVPLMTSSATIGAISVFLRDEGWAPHAAVSIVQEVADVYVLYLATHPHQQRTDSPGPSQRQSVVVTENQYSEISPLDLSARQRHVLELLSQGLTYDQIAARIGFSHSTVRMEILKAYRAFGVTSRRDAVAAAMRWGLVAGN